MPRKSSKRRSTPEWAEQIEQLRHRLDLSQSRLGQQLQYSAMAISRWERGLQEPPADCYIKLGDLAGNPDCWYFWERAGLKSSDVIRALPLDKRLFPKSTFPDFDICKFKLDPHDLIHSLNAMIILRKNGKMNVYVKAEIKGFHKKLLVLEFF